MSNRRGRGLREVFSLIFLLSLTVAVAGSNKNYLRKEDENRGA